MNHKALPALIKKFFSQPVWDVPLMNEILGMCEEDGWVSVADRLPEEDGKYIVYGRYASDCPMNVFESNFYKKGRCFRTDIRTKSVTHWQPLPAPPLTTNPISNE